jgi:hypothetical protein
MNIVIALLAALIITGGVAPQTKPVVDPIIVGLAVGAIAAPLAVSAGVTGSASILGTTYTNANVVAAGVGAVASAAQAKSQIEATE